MIDYDRLLIATGAQANVYSIEGLEETVVFRSLADDALGTSPVTIGPASDGGHYLIGMRAPGVPLFEGVEWGTDRVLAQTEALANAQGLDIVRLLEQHDVDTVEEFVHWQQQALCFARGDGDGLEPVVEDEW